MSCADWNVSEALVQRVLGRGLNGKTEHIVEVLKLWAVHEAGHLVMHLEHRSQIFGAGLLVEGSDNLGEVHAQRESGHRRRGTECCLGGPVAEELYGGRNLEDLQAEWVPGDGTDWDNAVALVGEAHAIRMWERVTTKVEAKILQLELLARRLLIGDWVTGAEIRDLLRSIRGATPPPG